MGGRGPEGWHMLRAGLWVRGSVPWLVRAINVNRHRWERHERAEAGAPWVTVSVHRSAGDAMAS